MKKKKTVLIQFISLIILFIGFIAIRYIFFEIHGMKQWPLILFIGCLAVLVVCWFLKMKITSLTSSISYMVGFFLSELLQTNGIDASGGKTNNMWIIWTVIIVAVVVVSLIFELLNRKKLE